MGPKQAFRVGMFLSYRYLYLNSSSYRRPGVLTQESMVSTLAPSLSVSSNQPSGQSAAPVRSPFQERLIPSEPADVRLDMDYDDDEDLPRKRRVPVQSMAPASTIPLSAALTLVESPYFNPPSSSTTHGMNSFPSSSVRPQRLPPHQISAENDPIIILDSSMETDHAPTVSRNHSNGNNIIDFTGTRQAATTLGSDFDYDNESLDATFFEELDQVE